MAIHFITIYLTCGTCVLETVCDRRNGEGAIASEPVAAGALLDEAFSGVTVA